MKGNSGNSKALIRYRLKRARATLQVAQTLLQQGEDPPSIVNRAYYAMFYAALALLATIGQQSSKHSGVLALFDQHFIKTQILSKEMGKFLHKAFDARQTGDYEEEAEITKEQASEVLGFAVQFVKSIEEKLSKYS
jgi:uncharacterized protein (UPF0332 family)